MEKEYFNIYDEIGNFIGIEERNMVHQKGLWHRTFQCWIIKKEGDATFVLFQKRHAEKDTFPNYYDTSAAGHLKSNELEKDGVRELEEELGLKVTLNELAFVATINEILTGENYIDKEIKSVYLYFSKQPLEEYTLQKEEVAGLIKVELIQAVRLFEGVINSVHAVGIERTKEGKLMPVEKDLYIKDFVPHSVNYYLKAFHEAIILNKFQK